MIMQSRIPLRLPRFALVLLVVVGGLTLPAWAQRAPDAPAPPTSGLAPTPSPVPSAPVPPIAAAPVVPARPGAPVPPQPPAPPRVDQSDAQSMTDFNRKFQAVAARMAEVRIATERQAQRAAAQAKQAEAQAQRAVAQAAQSGKPVPTPFLFMSPLPQEAQVLVDRFEESSDRLREEVETKIQAERTALIAELQKLQDTQARAGNLDEAIAIRDRIRAMQNDPSDAWFLRYALPKRVGVVSPSTPKTPEP